MEEQITTTPSCKKSVMHQIECGELCPRSKAFFTTRFFVIWLLWGITVVVGALAVAVVLFALLHHRYALFEATHSSFWLFVIEILPLLWLGVFLLMVAVSVYNVRHTKHGYRYPLWQILGSSILLSFVGGGLLQLGGIGYKMDHHLGESVPRYNSQEKIDRRLWQNPREGRLLGTFGTPLPPPSDLTAFTDVQGTQWQVNINELTPPEQQLLQEQKTVRLIGVMSTSTPTYFHACGAFMWKPEATLSLQEMKAMREVFETKIHGFSEQAEHAMLRQLQAVDDDEDHESPCMELPPVQRMPK